MASIYISFTYLFLIVFFPLPFIPLTPLFPTIHLYFHPGLTNMRGGPKGPLEGQGRSGLHGRSWMPGLLSGPHGPESYVSCPANRTAVSLQWQWHVAAGSPWMCARRMGLFGTLCFSTSSLFASGATIRCVSPGGSAQGAQRCFRECQSLALGLRQRLLRRGTTGSGGLPAFKAPTMLSNGF